MTPEQRLARGDRARQLVESEPFKAALDAVDAHIKEQLFQTKPEESDRREQLYHEARGLVQIAKRLHSWVADAEKLRAEQKE